MKSGEHATLVKNLVSMILWQASNYVVPLITLPYLTRVLQIKSYGQYALSFYISAYLVLVTDWGFSLSASGQVARAGRERVVLTNLLWHTLLAKTMLALLSLSALSVIVALNSQLLGMSKLLLAASLMSLANIATLNWFLQGLEKLGVFAIVALIGRVLTIPLTLLLVKNPSDAWIAVAIQPVSGIIVALVSIHLVFRTRLVGRPNLSFGHAWQQIRHSWHYFVSALSANIYTTTNSLILAAISGPLAVGYYAPAERIRSAAQGVLNPISQVAYPRASRLMDEDRELGLRFSRLTLLAQAGVGLIAAISIYAAAPLIISVIAGPGYENAVEVLRWFAFNPFVVSIGSALITQFMLPLGMQTEVSRISTRAAIINLCVAVPAIWLFGAKGAAASILLAECSILVFAFMHLRSSNISILPTRVLDQ